MSVKKSFLKHRVNEFLRAVDNSQQSYELSSSFKKAILYLPILIIVIQALLLIPERTRSISYWLLEENKPVELATFFIFFIGGIAGLVYSIKNRSAFESRGIYTVYLLLSIALILIALEEVAWGQWLFGFDTPEQYKLINMQGETTIHNLKGLQGNSEVLRVIYGIAGIFAIGLSANPSFDKIKAPVVLWTWYAIIFIHALVDFINDFMVIHPRVDNSIQRTSELIELLIAMSAVLYMYINLKKIFRSR